MKSKRIVTLFGFACIMVLTLILPSSAIAGDVLLEAGTWITTDASGAILISTAILTNPNGRTWSLIGESNGFDFSLGGMFDKIAPVQEQSYGEGWMTGPKRFENVTVQRVKHTDGSIAYIMIMRGKATVIDSKTMKIDFKFYLFLDLDQDGLPDFQLGEPLDLFYTSRHISAAIPFLKSLPAPANYPEP